MVVVSEVELDGIEKFEEVVTTELETVSEGEMDPLRDGIGVDVTTEELKDTSQV